MPVQIEDPSLGERKRARETKKREDTSKGMTLAEMLTIRAREQVIEIPLENSRGSFVLPLHVPNMHQMDVLLSFESRYISAMKSGDLDAANNIGDEVYDVLAELCPDASITADFLKSGIINQADFVQIVQTALAENFRRVRDFQGFRKERRGKGSDGSPNRTRKTPA